MAEGTATLTKEELGTMISSSVSAEMAKAPKSLTKEEIGTLLDEKLKSIKFEAPVLGGKYTPDKEVKVFNPLTGKVEGCRTLESESERHFNKMLYCLVNKDRSGVEGISKEIDEENAKRAELISGIKTPTASRSDSAAVGGYAVPDETWNGIIQMIYKLSGTYAAANKSAIIANNQVVPVMYGFSMTEITNQATAVTESNPTFTNPTVSVARVGGWSSISNEMIDQMRQKGVDLVSLFVAGHGSAWAKFLDLHLVAGNVSGNSDLVDGMIFDANTTLDTATTKAAFKMSHLSGMEESISAEADQGSLRWICNRLVKNLIGDFESTGGQKLFPQWLSGGEMSPLGIPMIVNSQIPSVLRVGEDYRSGGTDNAIVLCDMSKFLVALGDSLRIAVSGDFYFTSDLSVIRSVGKYGCKVLISNTASTGAACRALEISAS